MKNKYILLILILAPVLSFGGGLKINLQSGFGIYSMTDLKTVNNMLIHRLPLPVKQMENFPGYLYYQGSMQSGITKNLYLGPMYAYHSTGARLSLADYSGAYTFDNLIHSHQAGLTIDYKFLSKNNFSLSFYTDGGFVFSKVKMTEVLKMTEPEESTTENLNYKSTGYFAEPGVSLNYTFKFLEPGIQIGYHIPISEKGLVNTGNDQKLYLNDGGQAKTGWGGIRVGFALGIYL